MLDLQFDALHGIAMARVRRDHFAQNPQHVFRPRSGDVGVVAAVLVSSGAGNTVSREVCERAVAFESCLGENLGVAVVPIDADGTLGTLVGLWQGNVGGPAIQKCQSVVNSGLGRGGGAFAVPVVGQINVGSKFVAQPCRGIQRHDLPSNELGRARARLDQASNACSQEQYGREWISGLLKPSDGIGVYPRQHGAWRTRDVRGQGGWCWRSAQGRFLCCFWRCFDR